MNSNNIGQVETVINIKEIIWDLLEQWKAVLITALMVMVLVAGAKYAKDMKGYNAAQAEKAAEKQSAASAEEQIADILESLPESERSTVITVVKQNEWIESQKEYLNNSILLNTDPTSQRTLVLDYYIRAAEDSDTVRDSLIFGYRSKLRDKKVAEALGKVIAPDVETKYISELMWISNSDSSGEETSSDAILEVNVVLPDGADPQEVEKTLTSILKEQSPELSGRICPHSIELMSAGEIYDYNSVTANSRTNILYSINNLQNNTKNMQTNLSDDQKAALEAITAIRTAENNVSDNEAGKEEAAETEISKPGLSKKYALLGFVLGVMMYAFIYLLVVIRKGCLLCAGDAALYTSSRLLGELYEQTEATGIKKLLKSPLVEKYRYGSRLDTAKQTDKMRSSVEAVCRHEGIKELTVFNVSAGDKLKEGVISELKKLGISVSELSASEDINENDLCDIADAVILTGNTTKVSALCRLTELLKDYDIKTLGSVYAAEI